MLSELTKPLKPAPTYQFVYPAEWQYMTAHGAAKDGFKTIVVRTRSELRAGIRPFFYGRFNIYSHSHMENTHLKAIQQNER